MDVLVKLSLFLLKTSSINLIIYWSPDNATKVTKDKWVKRMKYIIIILIMNVWDGFSIQ